MNFIQTTLQVLEVGKGQIVVRIIPILTAFCLIAGAYDTMIYRGLNDAQSMDNAQLARQIVRRQGFTTEFLRPYAVAQLRDYAASQSLVTGRPRALFPPDQFPAGIPRPLPDTYNAPGYPYLLAAWFYLTHPDFNQPADGIVASHMYSGDRWIPLLNQVFVFMTAILVFAFGHRLFDERVAWISLLAFLGTDLVWHFTVTALSTNFLMFLVTAMLMCAMEIVCVGEKCFESEDHSFAPAWLWGLAVALLLAAACLTRLHLLVLLIPLCFLLIVMPQASFSLGAVITLVVIGLVTPWFLHVKAVSGSPFGSNFPLLLYGGNTYSGNQVYCLSSIPSYEKLLREASAKEVSGFRWHFEQGWNLLGSNPFILLFAAAILHQFKRRRTRLFYWFLIICALVIIAANNLGSATPDPFGPWNTLIVLLPCMVVFGAAFFFILLDRLDVQMMLLNRLIVIVAIVFTLIPLTISLTSPNNLYFNFPPYVPPRIKSYAQLAQPNEWVTSDMPWATAWYGDRASLWLPDSISDFEDFHKNICPTGILILTPITWSQPLSTFTTGEYKDWLSFVEGLPAPVDFPLVVHADKQPVPPYIFIYSLWSDLPRWEGR